MTAIINGVNGKLIIVTVGVWGIGVLALLAYGIKHSNSLSVSYGNVKFAFSTANAIVI
jgi:hypothetical protein